MVDLAGLHHASLSVSDLERSARWYQDVMGLEVAFTEDGDGRRAVIMGPPGGGAVLAVVQHAATSGADRFDPTRVGLDHLAFAVAARDDLDHWAAHLADRGVVVDGPHDVPPGAIVNLKDPDGIALSLFWDR